MDNPFPLNIPPKEDSFEKQQLLANVPEQFKYTAEEFNKIIKALEYLALNIGADPSNGNSSSNWVFSVSEKSMGSISSTESGKISIVHNQNNVTEVVFDSNYSKYLKRLFDLQRYYGITLRLLNKTQAKQLIATISKLEYADSSEDNIKIIATQTIRHQDIEIDDNVEIIIDFDYKKLAIKNLSTDASNLEVSIGSLNIQHNNTHITHVKFDYHETKYVLAYRDALTQGKMVYITLENKSEAHVLIAKVTTIDVIGNEDQTAIVHIESGNTFSNFAIDQEVKYSFNVSASENESNASLPPIVFNRLEPISLQPSQTQTLKIYGEYLTVNTTVAIEGQTVNSVEYKFDANDNPYLEVNISTSAIESEYDIILNNGSELVLIDALLVSVGVVTIPTSPDWTNVQNNLDVSMPGEAKISVYDANQSAQWHLPFNSSQDFKISFQFQLSPLGPMGNDWRGQQVVLRNSSNDSAVCTVSTWYNGNYTFIGSHQGGTYNDELTFNNNDHAVAANWLEDRLIELKWEDGLLQLLIDGNSVRTFTTPLDGDYYLHIMDLDMIDIVNLKHIALP